MRRPAEQDRGHARQARQVAVVLIATVMLWMFLTWAGGFYGWEPRFALLIDFLALAGFAWAMIVALRLWRARRPGAEHAPQDAPQDTPRDAPRGAPADVPAGTRHARGAGRAGSAGGGRPWHEMLGVARDASPAEIRAAYRRRARELRAARDRTQLRALAAARDRGLRTTANA